MAIVNLVDTLTGTRDHITRFQASVAQMPPMTGHFKRARKKVTGMLGELLAEFQFLIAEGKKMGDEMGGYDA